MKASNIISIILVISIILTVIGASIYKVYSNHRSDLLRVVNQKIEEATEKCVLEGNCTEETITLDYLIQNNYLEEQVHPITKEFISHDSTITCSNYECVSSIK